MPDWLHNRDREGRLAQLRGKLQEYEVLPGLRPGLERYLLQGVPTGHFLQAVLSNDLREAFARADYESRRGLFDVVAFLHNEAPNACWGSPESYKAWVAQHGAEGVLPCS